MAKLDFRFWIDSYPKIHLGSFLGAHFTHSDIFFNFFSFSFLFLGQYQEGESVPVRYLFSLIWISNIANVCSFYMWHRMVWKFGHQYFFIGHSGYQKCDLLVCKGNRGKWKYQGSKTMWTEAKQCFRLDFF